MCVEGISQNYDSPKTDSGLKVLARPPAVWMCSSQDFLPPSVPTTSMPRPSDQGKPLGDILRLDW